MSERRPRTPERPGVQNLAAAIDVRTQVVRGYVVAGLLTVLLFIVFVLLPDGSAYGVGWMVLLAFVLWFAAGMLATIVFAGWRVYRLTQSLDESAA